jgi:hypothetical protein
MPGRALCSLLLALAAFSSAGAQDALVKLRAQYASAPLPVDKAKVLAKLGSRELDAVRSDLNAGNDEKALAAVERYRDAVRDTTQALSASGIDASSHSSGFKELQISLRVSIRRLDDLTLSLQQDLRPSFRAVRSDIEAAENTLIDALFPVREPKRPRVAGPR